MEGINNRDNISAQVNGKLWRTEERLLEKSDTPQVRRIPSSFRAFEVLWEGSCSPG
jgi:hypothetical protein